MKKNITIALLLLVSVFGFAQNKGTLKFLGIPVDGTKQQMVMQLQEKGFTYNTAYDYLSGEFNGKNVEVSIHTNHRLVDRVYVSFPETTEENIRIEFNKLLGQFQKNGKYTDLSMGMNQEISDDEDISYEMSVHNKRYQASFYYYDPERDITVSSSSIDKYVGVVPDTVIAILRDLSKASANNDENRVSELYERYLLEMQKAILTAETDKAVDMIVSMSEISKSLADGCVWFMIHSNYGKYKIGLYYDNLHNQANGEDL